MSVSSLGISISAKASVWQSSQRLAENNLERRTSEYEHEILANGGFWSCRFTFKTSLIQTEEWFRDGVGREIVVRNEAQSVIWEGVVNVVSITAGAVSLQRGPLLDITNQLQVVYQTVSYNTNPPVGGQRQQGGVKQNTDSMALYGTLHTYLSGGVGSSDEMDNFGDNYINERAWPQVSINFNLTDSSEPSVTLECVGYAQLLNKDPYVQIANSGTENASTKIQNVLAANSDSLYTNFGSISTNTIQVPQYENEQNMAWSIIKDVVARGDSSGNRWLFGIEGERIPYYKLAPTAIEYYYKLTDKEPKVTDTAGSRILPWNVKPGKWIMVSDFLIGQSLTDPLALDPRTSFIESVRYSSVWGLQLNGSKDTKLAQQMARLGFAGAI